MQWNVTISDISIYAGESIGINCTALDYNGSAIDLSDAIIGISIYTGDEDVIVAVVQRSDNNFFCNINNTSMLNEGILKVDISVDSVHTLIDTIEVKRTKLEGKI